MALNAFRYLGMKSMDEVDRLEIPEYKLLMKASNLRQVDDEYRLHEQAFLTVVARATKGKKGTPVYKRFKDFFDYESAIKKILSGDKHKDVMHAVSALLKEVKEKKKNG